MKPLKEIKIEEIRHILLTEDSVLKAFVGSFEDKTINSYDFNKDFLKFLSIKKYERAFDNLEFKEISSCNSLFRETMKLIDIIKQEHELRDGWRDTWSSDLKDPAKEEVFGRKFRGMGFAFFSKFPEVTFIPQTGTGNGLLDFAVIHKDCRIAIELKKLCNSSPTGEPSLPAYLHGIKRQLPHYTISLPASNAIYLTIQHYRETRRGGKNHDFRANEIRGMVNRVQDEIKSQLGSFDSLYYINIDVSPKRPPSRI